MGFSGHFILSLISMDASIDFPATALTELTAVLTELTAALPIVPTAASNPGVSISPVTNLLTHSPPTIDWMNSLIMTSAKVKPRVTCGKSYANEIRDC